MLSGYRFISKLVRGSGDQVFMEDNQIWHTKHYLIHDYVADDPGGSLEGRRWIRGVIRIYC